MKSHEKNLILTRSNIWILQSIHIAKFKGAVAELDSLIGTADWLDHSIPTFAEFNNAVYNLKQAGLLVQKDGALKLGKPARLLFKEFEAFYPLKQFEALCSRLNVLRPAVNSDHEYANAVQAYVRGSAERNGL